MNSMQGNVAGRKPGASKDQLPATVDPEELLSAVETATLLRQEPQTLAQWRCKRRGPNYLRVGRSIYYRRADISTWLASQMVRPAP